MRWWWMRCPILTTDMTTPASGHCLVFVVLSYVFSYDAQPVECAHTQVVHIPNEVRRWLVGETAV
jgi:hypothetical protein